MSKVGNQFLLGIGRRFRKKTLLSLLCVFLVFTTYVVVPVYSCLVPTVVMETKTLSLEVLGLTVAATITRVDVYQGFQHSVKFSGTCRVGEICVNVTTEEYPYEKLLYSDVKAYGIPADWKYTWDGNITFVKAPGPSTTFIKYDHPDNYDTYRSGEVNVDYDLRGHDKIHHHIAQYRIEEDKSSWTLVQILAGIEGLLIAALTIPEGVISKVIAGVLLLIIGIIEALGQTKKWFLENILQTELGDGWTWLWGFGSWWIFKWWWQSFGAWRDWGWLFVVFNWNVYNQVPRGGGGGGKCYYLTC